MADTCSLKLDIDLPADCGALRLYGFEGREAVSELFDYTLDLCMPSGQELRFESILGREVTVTVVVDEQSPRRISGIVSEIARVGSNPRYVFYEARLVPSVALLDVDVGYRAFSEVSLEQVFEAYLKEYPYRCEFREEHLAQDYTVKYAESSWSHLARLARQEGCHYYFADEGGRCRLVFADNWLHAPLVSGVDELPSRLQGVEPHVWKWKSSQEITPWKVRNDDYHHESPQADLSFTAEATPRIMAGCRQTSLRYGALDECTLEARESFAQRYRAVDRQGRQDGGGLDGLLSEKERQARFRLEQEVGRAIRARARTNFSGMRPGYGFQLSDAGADSGRYVIMSIKHGARVVLEGSDGWKARAYTCKFTCRPATLPWRPRPKVDRPRCRGVATGDVVTFDSQEISCDDLGSVKVRFPWDKELGIHSPWIRHRQARAGGGIGDFFLPRAGHEVVVAFEEGHPERPLVLGSLYSASRLPPESRETHRHVQGYWVRSQGGTRQETSRFTFDNAAGREKVTLASARDARITSDGDLQLGAGGNLSLKIGYDVDDTEIPASDGDSGSGQGHFKINVAGEALETIAGDRHVSIAGNLNVLTKGVAFLYGYQTVTFAMACPAVLVSPVVTYVHGLDTRLVLGGARIEVILGQFFYTLRVTLASWDCSYISFRYFPYRCVKTNEELTWSEVRTGFYRQVHRHWLSETAQDCSRIWLSTLCIAAKNLTRNRGAVYHN
ncbi:Phage-related baseplate assembly protein [Planctomycetes bacterium Pan216]|uniref:Phage-related baseplate assembly protein n=1 Tax=Kolteria novifilia TaxID=2527975 RepID=A0A518AZI9_9BACT|nr:Phage-related baseplate assembly protein [Planctomycetes bacterium Pan216]